MGRVAFLLVALVVGVAAADAEEKAKGWLGVELKDITKEEAEKLGWDGPRGAKVLSVVPSSPAEGAGLKASDVLDTLDGFEIENKAQFEAAIASKLPGSEIAVRIERDGKKTRLPVKLAAAPAQGEAPILQLDTGGHQTVIAGITFTPDGKYIVSAGDQIRIWDWRAGKTVRTIRGQLGLGDVGKIFTMALSPNGRLLAVGTQDSEIRLYDFKSGELEVLLKADATVDGLAFSPDSKRLITGHFDHQAIIWDVEKGTALHRLQGHREDVETVSFTPDGERVVTGSDDHTLRLWRVDNGALIQEMTGHGDAVSALAVSVRDGNIASGDGSGEIRLWNGKTGTLERVFANQGGTVGSLRYAPDGRLLLSTCFYSGCKQTQRIYNAASGQEMVAYTKHDGSVSPGAFSPDGGLVATAGGADNEIHVWDPRTGETMSVLKGTGRRNSAVGFSADGRSIAWGTGDPCQGQASCPNSLGPLEFSLHLPGPGAALVEPDLVTSQETWVRAKASFGRLSLAHRKGGIYGYDDAILDLLKDGKPSDVSIERSLTDGYGHECYSFTHDGTQIISGGIGGVLSAYDLDGKRLGEFVGHEGDVRAVALSPDGRYLVSGAADQTVRLWNLKTRELLVTLFRGLDREWVVWTPQGYYAASPGADKIVGWHINKGADKAADYVTAEQLRKRLYRPDIVAKAITIASAEEAVRTSNGTEFKLSDLLSRPAPQLRISSPAQGSTVKLPSAEVGIALAPTPDPVTRIRIQVNGRQLDDHVPEGNPSFAAGKHVFPVPLAKGKNTIVVTAQNETGWSKVQDGTLTLINERAGELDKRGTLYILAIGVSKYPGVPKMCAPKRNCDLDFTGKDAIAFADAMEKRLGPLHTKIVRRVLVNGGGSKDAPTSANIVDALSVLGLAEPTDTVAVFLAGHGVNDGPNYDGPNYRFVSTDAAILNGLLRQSTIVPWYAIEEAIDGAKGRRLLFIDTCHSAGAYNQRLGNAAYYANILAYSSARQDQEALERPEYDHGLFTYALVEGLSGAADLNHDGRVDTAELAEYLRKRVPELAKKFDHQQEPQFFKGRDAETYPLAALR